MKNSFDFNTVFDLLTTPGERIPLIHRWMKENVWSESAFKSMDIKTYFESGEKQIQKLEELILTSSNGIYDELSALAEKNSSLLEELKQSKTALIIFDGTSIRELPLLESLAVNTGFQIIESNYQASALPSDTVSFVEQRLVGKSISPSQLESRKELSSRNIKSYYYDTPIRHFEIKSSELNYLLWSSFPDGTYTNFEARNSLHFETFIKQFDLVWKNIVMAIPRGYRIIITSDHGYVYLNNGFESQSKGDMALRFLNQERFRYYSEDEEIPLNNSELKIISNRRLGILKGRIKNRPKGQSANKVFRHGGLSLMEVLTPWLIIQRS
ncbi:MAG: hypothetical protein IPH11_15380 [Ignavibacteriales bacterium]|nr:hypothetical protein [Ignavibacteriales bacterium]